MARPLSEFPDALTAMAKAASGAQRSAVPKITLAVRAEVERQGSRHHINGRGGQPVKLGAKSNVRGDVGNVEGAPAGFWRIVTDGSAPHLIASRFKRGGGRASNRARTLFRILDSDSTFGGSAPIRIGGVNYRQYAHHPGHGPQGQPWRKAMDNARPIAGRVLEQVTTEGLARAWIS
jgi:hypothetical protein